MFYLRSVVIIFVIVMLLASYKARAEVSCEAAREVSFIISDTVFAGDSRAFSAVFQALQVELDGGRITKPEYDLFVLAAEDLISILVGGGDQGTGALWISITYSNCAMLRNK